MIKLKILKNIKKLVNIKKLLKELGKKVFECLTKTLPPEFI